MAFNWVSAIECPSCKVFPQSIDSYDDLGYPRCPVCGTTIRPQPIAEKTAVARAQTE